MTDASALADDILGLTFGSTPGALWVVLPLLAVGILLEGPVVTIVGGSLVGAGLLGFWTVWLVALVADIVSDTLYYLIGRCGRRPRVAPLLVRLGLTDRRWESLCAKVQHNLGQVVVGAKLIDMGAIPAFMAIGLAGVRFHRLLAWATAVAAVRTAILVGIGWWIGGRFASELAGHPWIIVLIGPGLALVLMAGRAMWKRVAVSRKENVCAS